MEPGKFPGPLHPPDAAPRYTPSRDSPFVVAVKRAAAHCGAWPWNPFPGRSLSNLESPTYRRRIGALSFQTRELLAFAGEIKMKTTCNFLDCLGEQAILCASYEGLVGGPGTSREARPKSYSACETKTSRVSLR